MDLKPESCTAFNRCEAPLCPLDASEGAIWFPNEPICTNTHRAKGLRWIRSQRKLVRKHSNPSLYFTKAMLNRLHSVFRGTTGLHPDGKGKFQGDEEAWLRARPDPDEVAAKHRANALKLKAQGKLEGKRFRAAKHVEGADDPGHHSEK